MAGATLPAGDTEQDGLAEPTPARRDPVQTRLNILHAATREFASFGFQGGRTERIAAEAGVGKRMIFHYFGSKDGLFAAVLEETYAQIRQAEAKLDLSKKSPRDAIVALVDFSFGWFLDHPEFVPLLNEANLHKGEHLGRSTKTVEMTMPLVDQLQSILRRGEAEGVFRGGVDPVDLYISMAGASYFYFSNQHTLGKIFDRDFMQRDAIAARRRHIIALITGFLAADAGKDDNNGADT